jgi:hypothetical protein
MRSLFIHKNNNQYYPVGIAKDSIILDFKNIIKYEGERELVLTALQDNLNQLVILRCSFF